MEKVTNQELFKGFSQYLDGQYFIGKDTADKETALNQYLDMVGLSKLVLLSGETQWHVDTAYDAHIERINTHTPGKSKNQFFALKEEGAPNTHTLFDSHALPRTLAINGYREHKYNKSISVVLRDVIEGTVALKVEDINDENDEKHILTAKLFAALSYESTVSLSRNFKPIIDKLRGSINGLQYATIENKVDQYGNLQPHIYITAKSFSLEPGLVFTSDEYGLRLSNSTHIAPPATECIENDEHDINNIQQENPFTLKYVRPLSTDVDSVVDDILSGLNITAGGSVDDDQEDRNEHTVIPEVQSHDDNSFDDSDNEAEDINHDEEVQPENVPTTSAHGEDDDMPKTIITIENLNADIPLERNIFYHALTKMHVENKYTGHRRTDTLEFLLTQGYVVGQSSLTDEQNSILRRTYNAFNNNIHNISKEETSDSQLEVAEEQNTESLSVPDEAKDSPTPTIGNESVDKHIQVEQRESVTQHDTGDDEVIKSERSSDEAGATTEITSEDKLHNNDVETDPIPQVEMPIEKTFFDLPNVEPVGNYEDSAFYAWLRNKHDDGSIDEKEMFNIGHFLIENGFDKKIHKPQTEQLKVLKAIHLAFNIDIENGLLNEVQSEKNETSLPENNDTDNSEINTNVDVPIEKDPDNEIMKEPSTFRKPSDYHALLAEVKSSLKVGYALNLLENDIDSDMRLYHTISNTKKNDFNSELYSNLHADALEEINRTSHATLDENYYQLNAFKGDLMEVVHFSNEEFKNQYILSKQKDGFIVDAIPVKSSQITCKIENAKSINDESIKIQASIHGPVGMDNIHQIFDINPGLSVEIKDNCHNIKGLTVVRGDNDVTCLEIVCEWTNYMPGTILRPTPEQFLKNENTSEFSITEEASLPPAQRKKNEPLLIDGISPNIDQEPVSQKETKIEPTLVDYIEQPVIEATKAQPVDSVVIQSEGAKREVTPHTDIEEVIDTAESEDDSIDIDSIEAHFDSLGL